jgi:hypothetical protein
MYIYIYYRYKLSISIISIFHIYKSNFFIHQSIVKNHTTDALEILEAWLPPTWHSVAQQKPGNILGFGHGKSQEKHGKSQENEQFCSWLDKL